jgi:anhydro-N-acetylmuramic acid kinase
MSGTSLDGVDAALVDFASPHRILATYHRPFAARERSLLYALCDGHSLSWQEVAESERMIAEWYAQTALTLIEASGLKPGNITALGAHGQTVWHHPPSKRTKAGHTVQCLDGHWLAARTGIDVVCDFRRMDMALGGEGAPLVPPFHAAWFGEEHVRQAVINIGGIANVTVLEGRQCMGGFDVGPGNTLLDHWYREHHDGSYDRDGCWASTGRVIDDMLEALLDDPYFTRPAPKSTGPEYFNLAWVAARFPRIGAYPPEDVQATLTALTARAIARSLPAIDRAVVCGGGVHNAALMRCLQHHVQAPCTPSDALGLNPDFVEAAAFAWLAWRRVQNLSGNLPAATGASRATILGSWICA